MQHVNSDLTMKSPPIVSPQEWEAAALADQLQESAAGMVVLGVGLEMFSQVVDAFAEKRYLNLW